MRKIQKAGFAGKDSFTLVELLITMVVAVLVLNGVIMSLVNSMVLNEYNQSFTYAMNISKAKIEEVLSRRSNFSGIVSTTGTLTAAANGIDGLYRIDVEDVVADELKNIKVAVCWKARGGKIIGDCALINSVLQWQTPYSSPCMAETAVAAH